MVAIKAGAARVRICGNCDYGWENTEAGGGGKGLNEGPQVLQHAGQTHVVYSCGASWAPTYKLGMLTLVRQAAPLEPASWF